MQAKTRVLVPLYYYPLSDETWKPLYDAISNHPDLDFLVVINPNSGPGDQPLPSHDYVREIPRLNAFKNCSTVGYVRIDYCRKPLKEVYDEIDRYAGWADEVNPMGLALHGIFLDETPNHYSNQRGEYLATLDQRIKATRGILGSRLIIHNPGTPPDSRLVDPCLDVVMTCEEPYEKYTGKEVQKRLSEYYFETARSGYMVSAVPKEKLERLVDELCQRGTLIFATDLVDDFYESFGETWSDFMVAMEKALKTKTR